MKPLPSSDFRAARLMLEDDDFGLSSGEYEGPTNLIAESAWKSIVSLPDDVSIRTSDKYGPELSQMWECWGTWGRVVLAVQELTKDPGSPTAIVACDAADEFQGATYCALVGFYRVAFSCLRNVVEQTAIATRLTMLPDAKFFQGWQSGSEKLGFGWAADTLPRSPEVAALEKHLIAHTGDCLFAQSPKGFARRFFVELSKYTHGATGFTNADSWESNGPIFVPKAFIAWRIAAFKTYALALHALKLAHPQPLNLPYGPPGTSLDQFRHAVVRKIPLSDQDRGFFDALGSFWP
jgi:hypothetical protein